MTDTERSEKMAALGRIGGSRPKNFKPEEIERRRARLIAMNKSRAKKPVVEQKQEV